MASRPTGLPLDTWKADELRRQENQRRSNRDSKRRAAARDRLVEMKQLMLMVYPVPPLGPVSRSVYLPPAGSIARSFFGVVR